MRKFIVLHSAEDYDFNEPIIVYIDSIICIRRLCERKDDKRVNVGTSVYAANWVMNVQESIADIMKRIKDNENND